MLLAGIERVLLSGVENLENLLDDGQFLLQFARRLLDLLRDHLQRACRRDHPADIRVVHGRDQRARSLVVEIERSDDAVRLHHYREFGLAVGGRDFHQHGGAADAHRCDRRVDPHVAGLRYLTGDEADRALHQADQRGIAGSIGAVDEFVQHHARIAGEVERGAVGEHDAERGAGTGLHHVALLDYVAGIQRDRDAIAHDGGIAFDLLDPADRLRRRLRRSGLRVLPGRERTGQGLDDGGSEACAFRRKQGRPLVAEKVADGGEAFTVGAGDFQVAAGALEFAIEQKLGTGNGDETVVCRLRRLAGADLAETERAVLRRNERAVFHYSPALKSLPNLAFSRQSDTGCALVSHDRFGAARPALPVISLVYPAKQGQ